VYYATSGPGTINLLTGISLAYKGRAPVIVIAGDVARAYIYRDGNQAFDLVGMFKPVTSMSLQVNKTERIPEMLHDAFRTAAAPETYRATDGISAWTSSTHVVGAHASRH